MHPYAKPMADMKNPQTNELSADFFVYHFVFRLHSAFPVFSA